MSFDLRSMEVVLSGTMAKREFGGWRVCIYDVEAYKLNM